METSFAWLEIFLNASFWVAAVRIATPLIFGTLGIWNFEHLEVGGFHFLNFLNIVILELWDFGILDFLN